MTVRRHGTIIFLHNPKTAGITLSNLLRRKLVFPHLPSWFHLYRAQGFAGAADFEQRVRLIDRLSARKQREIRMCQGHFGYGMHEYLKTPHFYFSIYREPVSRAYSAYKYLLGQGGTTRLPDGISVRDAINFGPKLRNFMLDNQQVRYLAGNQGRIIQDEPVTRTMLDVAIERVHQDIHVVGLQERFAETLVLLGDHCGWRSTAIVSYNKSNRGRSAERASELAAKDREALIEANQLDLELYEQVKIRFQADLERFGVEQMRVAVERHEHQCRAETSRLKLVDSLIRTAGRPVKKFIR